MSAPGWRASTDRAGRSRAISRKGVRRNPAATDRAGGRRHQAGALLAVRVEGRAVLLYRRARVPGTSGSYCERRSNRARQSSNCGPTSKRSSHFSSGRKRSTKLGRDQLVAALPDELRIAIAKLQRPAVRAAAKHLAIRRSAGAFSVLDVSVTALPIISMANYVFTWHSSEDRPTIEEIA